ADEQASQVVHFNIVNDSNPGIFSVTPTLDPDGTLHYTPSNSVTGTSTITISLQDNGGTALGGSDTSPTQTFNITVSSLNANTYVNDNWKITNDVGPSGLSLGDTVVTQGGDTNVGSHTYGIDAFSTIANGITFTSPGGTVHIVEGNYNEANNVVNKALTIDGVSAAANEVVGPPSADSHT